MSDKKTTVLSTASYLLHPSDYQCRSIHCASGTTPGFFGLCYNNVVRGLTHRVFLVD